MPILDPTRDADTPIAATDTHSAPPRPTWRRGWLLWAVAGLGVLAAVSVGLRLAHPGVLPGTYLAGSDVSAMDRGELRAFVHDVATRTQTTPVTVTYRDHLASLLPAEVGYGFDAAATADAVWARGRTGNPVTDTWAHLRSLWGVTDARVTDHVDDGALTAWVDGVADTIDRQVGNGGLTIDPETLDVDIVAPTAGFDTDRQLLRTHVRTSLAAPVARDVTAPVTVTPVQVDVDSVHAVAARAQRVLAGDVTLTAAEVSVTLTPSQVAPLLTLETDGSQAQLGVSATAIEQHLTDLGEQLTYAPVDARFDLPREPVRGLDAKGDVTWEPIEVDVDIVPGIPGRTFDVAIVAEAMSQQLRTGDRTVSVELPEVAPTVTATDLEQLQVTHLLGTFTTYFQAGEPRALNIRHLADVLDDRIIRPGEQFSINRTSGERTCSKGYARDGMIYNGELIKVCGGGVSQVGTTVFNAAFFSGVQIDQHKPHSWFISRYPVGREATLDFATDIDVKFTNDTGNGLVLRTHHTPSSVTISLYGSSDVERVSAVHGPRHNVRQPPVRYVEDPTLPPGTEKVVDGGHGGFDIDVTRVARMTDGETVRDSWSHRYVTSPRVVHRNSQLPEPAPSPSQPAAGGGGQPSPSPTQEPSPQPSAQPSPTPSNSEA